MGLVEVRGGGSLRRALVAAGLLLGAGAASAVSLSGCNWSTFSSDADKAPVRSIAAPSNFKAADFGRSLLPLSSGQGKAAAFVATSINDMNIALVTIDTAGGVSSAAVPGTSLTEVEDSVISSLVEDASGSPTKLLLGSPKLHNLGYGRVYTYALSPMLDETVTTLPVPLGPTEPGLGRGLAAGTLAGVEAKADYVVASDSQMVVLVDGAVATSAGMIGAVGCDPTFDLNLDARYRLKRAVLTARLWLDPPGTNVQQVVSASPHAVNPGGRLSFFSVTGGGSPFALNCLASATAPALTPTDIRPRFGTSLASGDFNGDGNVDLLVGAPGQNAYVYFGPFPPGGLPTPVTIADSEGVDFGYAVAALNIDGHVGDEALIADPLAAVGGQDRAGRVTAFAWQASTSSMVAIKTYADHSPEANANFGSTVNALKFCSATPSPAVGTPCPEASAAHILMVGASNEVFIYYGEGSNIPVGGTGGNALPDVRVR